MAPCNINDAPPARRDGPLEIVFSFDTTGSMASSLDEVRNRIQDMIKRLATDIPALRIAIFAHGDYCDKHTYVTKFVDFCTDGKKLCDFVKNTKGTGGGDFQECYELVLRQVREKLSWSPGSQRSLVMIGDAPPHEPGYKLNVDNIDWREETDRLNNEMGVRIYAVQCGNHGCNSTNFYKELAKRTRGKHLQLDQFSNIFDLMMAICYKEHGVEYFEAYEHEVRNRDARGIGKDLDGMFADLRDPEKDSSSFPLVSSPAPAISPLTSPSSSFKRSPVKKTTKRRATDDSSKAGKKVKTEASVEKAAEKKPTAKPTRLPRENVLRNKVAGQHRLKWSDWELAIVPTPPVGEEKQWWPLGNSRPGYRKRRLFQRFGRTAVYEIAVQRQERCKKFVVYYRTSVGVSLKFMSWDYYLLGDEHVCKEVDTLLRAGWRVYVRRACLDVDHACPSKQKLAVKRLAKVNKTLSAKYDYAWRKNVYGRRLHRSVKKAGYLISDGSC